MASQLADHCDSSLANRLSCSIWSQSPSYKPHYRLTFEELLSLLLPSAKPLFNRLFVLSAVRFRQWCNAKVPNWEKYSTTVGATGRLIGCIPGEEGLVEFSCLVSLLAWGLISVSVGDTLAVVACTPQVITASLGECFPLYFFFFCQFKFIPPHSSLSSFPFLHWLCW